jgi:hypothetical protein
VRVDCMEYLVGFWRVLGGGWGLFCGRKGMVNGLVVKNG